MSGPEVEAYETEQEIIPVHVKVLNFPTVDIGKPQSVSTNTYADTATILPVLQLDPMRFRATLIISGTGTVVLCHTQNQAQASLSGGASAVNSGVSITAPGTGPSIVIPLEHIAPMWAVLSGATPLLSVIVERRA